MTRTDGRLLCQNTVITCLVFVDLTMFLPEEGTCNAEKGNDDDEESGDDDTEVEESGDKESAAKKSSEQVGDSDPTTTPEA
ncbi:hypothetical protein HAX54_044047, partial [Datura stramonium]|nr:hypothetical protein [Datura stramonium]